MKRRGEFVLSIIGVIIAVISFVLGIVLAVSVNSGELTEMIKYSLGTEAGVSASDVDLTIKVFNGLLWGGIVSSLVALLGGLIAIFLLKGGKTKAAGIIFIITGILTIFQIWPLIFFIIPGIMCLARKEPERIEIV